MFSYNCSRDFMKRVRIISSVPLPYTALPTPLRPRPRPPQPPLLLPLYVVSANNGLYFQLVLLGAEEGLYSMSLEKSGRSSPRALPGIDRAFQLDIISDLNLLIMIAGTILVCPPYLYTPLPRRRQLTNKYLTIIPRARTGSESISDAMRVRWIIVLVKSN